MKMVSDVLLAFADITKTGSRCSSSGNFKFMQFVVHYVVTKKY